MHDMREFQQVELGKAARVTTTANNTGVDISDYIGTIKLPLSVTAVSGTTPTLNCKIQDSDDNSTYADVTGGAFTEVTTSDAFETLHLDTRALKKYIRLVDTLGGTSPVFDRSLVLVGRKQIGGQG